MPSQDKMTILLMIIVSILLLILTLYVLKSMDNMNKKLKLKEYEININTGTGEEIFSTLDRIIAECFSEYTVLNIEYKETVYIDSELEKQITTDVSHKILDRLSPTLIAKISLVYNINNLSLLISERVYLHTLNYTIEKNGIKE